MLRAVVETWGPTTVYLLHFMTKFGALYLTKSLHAFFAEIFGTVATSRDTATTFLFVLCIVATTWVATLQQLWHRYPVLKVGLKRWGNCTFSPLPFPPLPFPLLPSSPFPSLPFPFLPLPSPLPSPSPPLRSRTP